MCSIGELEPCEIWEETTVTARKRHICSACRGLIEPGSKYLRHFSKFEGDVTFEKLCAACIPERVRFCDEHIEDGVLCAPLTFRTFLSDCTADEDGQRRWGPLLEAMKKREAERRDRFEESMRP